MKNRVVILLAIAVIFLSYFAVFTPSYTGYATGKWIEEEIIIPHEGALPYLSLSSTSVKRGKTVDLNVFTGTEGIHTLKLYKVNNHEELDFVKEIPFTARKHRSYLTGLFGYSHTASYHGERTLTFRISKSYLPGTYKLVAEGVVGTTTLDFEVK